MGGSSDPMPAIPEVKAAPPPPTLANTAVVQTAADIRAAGTAANKKGFAGTILTSPEGVFANGGKQPLHPKLLGETG